MKKLFFILAIALFTVLSVRAQQVTFEVQRPQPVVVGNRFYLTFRLTNGEADDVKAPQVPGCKLLSPTASVSTMQSYQNINGRASSSTTVDYSFMYRAEKEGKVTVPAVTVMVDGRSLRSSAAQLTILPPDQAPQRQQPSGYGNPYATQQQVHYDDIDSQDQAATQPISGKDIFVRIILNKSHAYEQEAIECTLKLYTKFQRINSFMMKTPPSYDGFLIDEVDTQAALNDVENYNGQNYITAILKKCIIFPQKSGKLTINSGTFELSVVQVERISNGFFISARPVEKTVQLKPYTSTIEISPLPHPQPAGFSGAVGRFQFESQMSSQQLRTGEAASLKYIITGTGNIKYVKAPTPEIPSEFEQYTPNSDVRTRIAGANVTGTVTAEYTMVPQSVGDFTIPGQEFVYFDPSTREYVTLTSPSYNLKVAKGSGITTSGEQSDIQAKNTDILHIKTGPKGLATAHRPLIYSPWYWIFVGLMVLILAASVWMYARRQRQMADVSGRRTAQASKVARRRLRAAEGFMKTHHSDEFYQELLRAMWGYLSDKLTIPASQLTRQNIVETMTARGVPESLSQQIIDILDACEMARYTPDASSDASVEQLYKQASTAINGLEHCRINRK